MKKLILLLVVCLLIISPVIAQQQSGAGANAGNQIATENQQANQGEETNIQNQERVQAQMQEGNYMNENGKQVQVQQQTNNQLQLKVGESSAYTNMQMTQEQTQLGTQFKATLSNGKQAEIKVMPDTASQKALEQLRLKVCTSESGCEIELKEVGSGEKVQAAYEVRAQKEAKVLGMFRTQMKVQAQVSAENGEIIRVHKPWWSFLASETEE